MRWEIWLVGVALYAILIALILTFFHVATRGDDDEP